MVYAASLKNLSHMQWHLVLDKFFGRKSVRTESTCFFTEVYGLNLYLVVTNHNKNFWKLENSQAFHSLSLITNKFSFRL